MAACVRVQYGGGGGGGTLAHTHAQIGQTALINAASFGHANCAQLLLGAGADQEAKNKVRSFVDDS